MNVDDLEAKAPGSKFVVAGMTIYLIGSVLLSLFVLAVIGLLVWAFLL